MHDCSASIHSHPRPWELERGRRNTFPRSNPQTPRKVSEMELQWTTRHWIHIEVHIAAHSIHNHQRQKRGGTRKKNTAPRSNCRRLRRWWKLNYDWQSNTEFIQKWTITAYQIHHHPRKWELERWRKNTSLRSNPQRLGRCWEWNYNGQLDIELTQKSTQQIIQSTTNRGHKNYFNAEEKSFSTF